MPRLQFRRGYRPHRRLKDDWQTTEEIGSSPWETREERITRIINQIDIWFNRLAVFVVIFAIIYFGWALLVAKLTGRLP